MTNGDRTPKQVYNLARKIGAKEKKQYRVAYAEYLQPVKCNKSLTKHSLRTGRLRETLQKVIQLLVLRLGKGISIVEGAP